MEDYELCAPVSNAFVQVGFDYIGEGYNGEYDPNDPDDRPLLRLDVLVYDGYQGFAEPALEDGWLYPSDGSICTGIPADTSPHTQTSYLYNALEILSDVVLTDASLKSAMANISYWS